MSGNLHFVYRDTGDTEVPFLVRVADSVWVWVFDPTEPWPRQSEDISDFGTWAEMSLLAVGELVPHQGSGAADLVEPFSKLFDQEVLSERQSVLVEAESLITGDRNTSYGSPTQNFQNTADLLNVQFRHKLTEELTATDVALIMIHLKMARLVASPDKRDNWVDIAGYAACGFETTVMDNDVH